MALCRQEHWSGLPLPCPRDLRTPGTEGMSPVSSALAGVFFTVQLPGKPSVMVLF